MLIPANPVLRASCKKFISTDLQHRPFPSMEGVQALFGSAREALYHGLRLLDHKPGTIHVPAYCCKSILLPIRKLGLNINFYEVGDCLEPIMKSIALNRGDVFLLVHYFGISQDAAFIKSVCQEYGVLLVEDCAHTLPDPGSAHPMGSAGIFSIYSLRKPLPLPDGGVLLVNDDKIKEEANNIPAPHLRGTPPKRRIVIGIDRIAFKLGWPNTMLLKDRLRERVGSSDDTFNSFLSDDTKIEISSETLHVLNCIGIGSVVKRRRDNYRYLLKSLSGIEGIATPFMTLPEGSAPWAFPVIVNDADNICASMRRMGTGAGRWPGPELPENIVWSEFPRSLSWVESLVLLPLHQDLDPVHLDKITKDIIDII